MSHLWTMDRLVGEWAVAALDGVAFALFADGSVSRITQAALGRSDAPVWLFRSGQGDAESWVLIAPGRVLVNGSAAWVGIRILRDRDEVRMEGGARWFFSTENLAKVEPFPVTRQAASCPRCKQPIDRETEAVRCPSCGVWHHQSAELPCWSYGTCCALCDQTSEFTNSFRWTPAQL